MAFKLCNSIRYGGEVQNDLISITQVVEKLDLQLLLERAAMGIVDLNAYQRSKNCDIRDVDLKPDAVEDLLNRPSSVLDRTFGFAREDGQIEIAANITVAKNNRKKKTPDPVTTPPAPSSSPSPAPSPAPPPAPSPNQ